jgi:hypothetical protein
MVRLSSVSDEAEKENENLQVRRLFKLVFKSPVA